MVHQTDSRFLSRLAGAIGLALAAIALAGCVNETSLDDLADAEPSGSPFAQALFKDYSYLAHSFGDVGAASGTSFDQEGSMSVTEMDTDVGALANAYAAKALLAARGLDVSPEPADDPMSHTLRNRLVRALDQGRQKAPQDAARAQADYDCWRLDRTVASQADATARCRRSFDRSLARLESEVGVRALPTTVASAPVAPVAPATAAPAPDYTVYFDFDSWSLTAEDLTVLTQAIAAARAGGQTHITVVGHTDTSGSSEYNQQLSVRRANVVKDVLVQMGARAEAVEVSGVGETDLAVQTADGVREPKNRRSVVTLNP
jgi:outer membrane protein OmpA-like peptidoglycan-associated protein